MWAKIACKFYLYEYVLEIFMYILCKAILIHNFNACIVCIHYIIIIYYYSPTHVKIYSSIIKVKVLNIFFFKQKIQIF